MHRLITAIIKLLDMIVAILIRHTADQKETTDMKVTLYEIKKAKDDIYHGHKH